MTTLLALHVILMSLSLLGAMAMLGRAMLSKGTPNMFLTANVFGTSVGITIGAVLLLNHPLDIRCVLLTSYLIAFWLAHSFVKRRNLQLQAAK